MIYRDFGKTGKKVSLLGFGGMRFKNIKDHDAGIAMMVEAAKGGVNYFDTAPKYFGIKGEIVFGKGFAELTRLKLPFYSSTKTFEAEEKKIRLELDGQLKRLGVNRIDFYHVWCITSLPDWETRKKKGVLKVFRALKEEGLIGHICVSSHLIGEEIKTLLLEGVFEGVLFGYSAYNYRTRQAAFDAVTAHNLGCAIMNPLGGGILPQHPGIFEFLRTRDDETVVEAGLRFLFSHDRISTVLVGFGDRDDVRKALRTVDAFVPLSAAELGRIKEKSSGSMEGLCTGCQYCDNCPEKIPIPRLMDAYNQKVLFKKDYAVLEKLRMHWDVSKDEGLKCVECGQCEKACTQHLPIMQRLKEIAAIP